MITPSVALSGGRTGLQGVNDDDAVGTAAANDLSNILDTVDVPIVAVRRDFVIAYFNKAAADVLGLSPLDIGRASRDIPVLAGLPRLEERCSQVIAGGVESQAEFRDGDKRFVVRISPYANANGDGQVTGTVLAFTNVTAFRASIDQAIYERECTKAILNTVADPLVVLSSDQRIQSGNRAFYTIFGVSRDETQGVPIYELVNGALDLAQLRTRLNKTVAGGHTFLPIEMDHVLPGKGRRTLILDARPLSLPGHSEHRVLVTFQDITARKEAEAANDLRAKAERKRSEEELRRSEAFLAEAQRASSTGSFSWRVATDEITWSDQLYRIFEFDQGMPVTLELIGTRVHPEDVPLLNDFIERARGSANDFDYEHRLQMPDGSVKYVHLIAHVTRDANGRLEYIGAAQDVTQRRLSEEALAKARSELAYVARVTSLGVLTASIAHEVNQPLASIITSGEAGLRWLDRPDPDVEEVRKLTKRVVGDARRASEIIDRIRSMATRRAPKPTLLSLDDIIEESMVFLRHELQSKSTSVSLHLPGALPQVLGDRTQLQQVVVNLAINAVQAMAQSGTVRRSILIRTMRSDPETVCCVIEDSGPGIDPAHIPRLFDSFFTTKDTGMGLGLPISQSIVQAHGGRIRADHNSALGGARFSFTLPCHSSAGAKPSGDPV
jgi:PAS domain S-box-containing protein